MHNNHRKPVMMYSHTLIYLAVREACLQIGEDWKRRQYFASIKTKVTA